MDFKREEVKAEGVKLSYEDDGGREVARAYLYVLRNGLHEEPVGYLEDVFVDGTRRRKGLATEIVRKIIEEAKRKGCYKLVATTRHTRPDAHRIYLRLGFKDWGTEFRLDL